MFIIVKWNSYADVSIVFNDNGEPMLFLFRREAERYAGKNLSSQWQIIFLTSDE
jgi:hypothetical protein